jgi:hypothetical protein
LTEHARDALAKRGILPDWMERALTTPDLIEAHPIDVDLEHRLTSIAEFENRVLRVVVNVKVTPPPVVTASFDRQRINL